MGRKIGKSAIEVMRERFPANASEIETYADAFDVLAEKVNTGGGGGETESKNVYVPFTVTVESEEEISVTTTANFENVKNDIDAKKNVIAEVTIDGVVVYMPLVSKIIANGSPAFSFGVTYDFSGTGEAAEPSIVRLAYSESGADITFTDLAVST